MPMVDVTLIGEAPAPPAAEFAREIGQAPGSGALADLSKQGVPATHRARVDAGSISARSLLPLPSRTITVLLAKSMSSTRRRSTSWMRMPVPQSRRA
jgi:hypothetical protein